MKTEQTAYHLSELMALVRGVIVSSMDKTYWVTAEIASLSTSSPRGHMYFELIEKEGNSIVAKARATLWGGMQSKQLLEHFQSVSRQQLKVGMKILTQVRVSFHQVFGFSLQILDIDATYSLGEMERQKQETIQRLEEEGLLHFNKQYVLPIVLQRIAVISSATAAGYQDFMHQLDNNEWGYAFQLELFQSVMQGEQAPSSIMEALHKIGERAQHFDAICIIRGGGSNIDLACFNDYDMSAALAQSTLPLLSGIGHERDTSIADMVANTRLKTPTAVAEFLLSHNMAFESRMQQAFASVGEYTKALLHTEEAYMERSSYGIDQRSRQLLNKHKHSLQTFTYELKAVGNRSLRKERNRLPVLAVRTRLNANNSMQKDKFKVRDYALYLRQQIKHRVAAEQEQHAKLSQRLHKLLRQLIAQKQHLDWIQQILQMSDPKQWLKKGLAIISSQGKIVSSVAQLKSQQAIEVNMQDGVLHTKIETIIKDRKYE